MIFRNDVDLFGWGIGPWAALFLVMFIFYYVYVFVVSFATKYIKKRVFINNHIFAKTLSNILFFLAFAGIFAIGFSCAWWLHTEDFNYLLLVGLGALLLSFARIFFDDVEKNFMIE